MNDIAYDNNNNFQFLPLSGIIPSEIKLRTNSKSRKDNQYLRNKTVKIQKNNFNYLKDCAISPHRRILESVFSCIQRMFGKYVTVI
ncbi:MAG: hypothetical protein MRJ93_01565 [Nitrososphaeraceae archaeon]|nr:hypothetical protein [Nitrososphaeraceae archaeon]